MREVTASSPSEIYIIHYKEIIEADDLVDLCTMLINISMKYGFYLNR